MKEEDFEDWYDKYRAAFADAVDMDEHSASLAIDYKVAKRSFDRGISAERAGRSDARFAFYGEQ